MAMLDRVRRSVATPGSAATLLLPLEAPHVCTHVYHVYPLGPLCGLIGGIHPTRVKTSFFGVHAFMELLLVPYHARSLRYLLIICYCFSLLLRFFQRDFHRALF